jgi:hypothetical protein
VGADDVGRLRVADVHERREREVERPGRHVEDGGVRLRDPDHARVDDGHEVASHVDLGQRLARPSLAVRDDRHRDPRRLQVVEQRPGLVATARHRLRTGWSSQRVSTSVSTAAATSDGVEPGAVLSEPQPAATRVAIIARHAASWSRPRDGVVVGPVAASRTPRVADASPDAARGADPSGQVVVVDAPDDVAVVEQHAADHAEGNTAAAWPMGRPPVIHG